MSGEQLKWSLQNGDLEVLKSLILSDKSLVNTEIVGRPPLCVAADYGQTECIEYLLSHGASINAADKYGITPLLSAIFEGHTECVRLLLSKGADKSLKAPSGESYIDSAEKDEIKNLLR